MYKKVYFVVFFLLILTSCVKDFLLKESSDIEIIEVKNQKMNISFDDPWEYKGVGYINVIKENNTWHLWYEAFFSNTKDRPDYNGALCYAYSEDGINWIKPNLGMYTFNGEDSNIVFKSNKPGEGIHGVSIRKTNNSPYKYVMVYSKLTSSKPDPTSPTRVYSMTSKDGFRWENEVLVLDHPSDTQNVLLKKDDMYYLFFRRWSGGSHAKGKRLIGYVKSKTIAFSRDSIQTLKLSGNTYSKDGQYYNSSIKLVDDRFLLFPTVYDPLHDMSKIQVAEGESLNSIKLITKTNMEISQKAKPFRLVAPQIISSEGNFFIYYLERNTGHNLKDTSTKFSFNRIEIKIKF